MKIVVKYRGKVLKSVEEIQQEQKKLEEEYANHWETIKQMVYTSPIDYVSQFGEECWRTYDKTIKTLTLRFNYAKKAIIDTQMRLMQLYLLEETQKELDKKKKKVHLLPLLICLPTGIILSFIEGKEDGLFALFGILPGLLFLAMAVLTKEKVGYGDGLVLIVTGVLLGLRGNLMMVFMGLFLAALSSIWLLIRKKAGRNTKIAFVPFLLPSLVLSLLMSGGFV